jgi:hypothetical protein
MSVAVLFLWSDPDLLLSPLALLHLSSEQTSSSHLYDFFFISPIDETNHHKAANLDDAYHLYDLLTSGSTTSRRRWMSKINNGHRIL